ncbi:MAG: response regulator [Atopobiaceae bacterium]|nr:response regulator [Atopobiaceae bacterium]MCI2173818.1 response regulator [Atopobiaceae bacterium]MCI2207540.1 response regulator [Atopobiaceae bacterium]
MYDILIVEDTDSEAENLQSHLSRYAAEHDTAFSVDRLLDSSDLDARAADADLVFLDVNLPGETGLAAAERLRADDCDTPLVFVTNLAQYAMQGYSVDALGFIVKSASYGVFSLCMDHAMRVLARNAHRTLSVATADGMRVLEVPDITNVHASGSDLRFHLMEGDTLQVTGALDRIETELRDMDAPFVRISGTRLANMARILRVSGAKLDMEDGSSISIGLVERRRALARIAEYLGGGV